MLYRICLILILLHTANAIIYWYPIDDNNLRNKTIISYKPKHKNRPFAFMILRPNKYMFRDNINITIKNKHDEIIMNQLFNYSSTESILSTNITYIEIADDDNSNHDEDDDDDDSDSDSDDDIETDYDDSDTIKILNGQADVRYDKKYYGISIETLDEWYNTYLNRTSYGYTGKNTNLNHNRHGTYIPIQLTETDLSHRYDSCKRNKCISYTDVVHTRDIFTRGFILIPTKKHTMQISIHGLPTDHFFAIYEMDELEEVDASDYIQIEPIILLIGASIIFTRSNYV